MKNSDLKLDFLLDILWLLPLGWVSIWLTDQVFTLIKSTLISGSGITFPLYFFSIPLISSLGIATVCFFFNSEFRKNVLGFKILFLFNFILSVILLLGIILLKPPIFIVYPLGISVIGVVVKMYTRFMLKGY